MSAPLKTAKEYDYIIIGSGFGGSVAAYKLVHSGARVLLLERGPWRDTKPVSEMGINERSPLPRGKYFYSHVLRTFSSPLIGNKGLNLTSKGLFEINYRRDMSIVCSSGIGGGSHVYSGLNVRPAVDNYWEQHLGKKVATQVEKYYDWMIGMMGATPPTADNNLPNFIGNMVADSPHFHADSSLEQPAMSVKKSGANNLQNNSFFGSYNGTKATLDDVMLKPALEQGLEILPLHECKDIAHMQNGNYRLECYDHKQKRYRFFTSAKVILAAGTLNSVKLLFKSRESGGLSDMPALGMGFGGNGDVPAFWTINTPGADYTQGLPCHGRFELKNYDNCPNLTAYGLSGLDDIPLPSTVKNSLRNNLVLVGMGADKADGVITYHKGNLGIRYIHQNNPILRQLENTFSEIAKRSGSRVWRTKNRPLTVHPLGGARLGSNQENSVINLKGEVHNNPGLYITDASALPSAPGSPPSMTIAAWSAYVCDQLIQQTKN